MMNSYIALDLETTGLEAKQEKITEIAAIKIIDGAVAGQFVTLVNPMRRLGMHITRLTGITDEMLKDAPPIEDVLSLIHISGNGLLLQHQRPQDIPAVRDEP